MILPFEKIQLTLETLFIKYQFSPENAQRLAEITAKNATDGVLSHSINRIPLFISLVKRDIVKTNTQAEKIGAFGFLERWDGNQGAGVINAHRCMNRAIELAKHNGISCVALRNTNHWMRGGYYAWQAADAGCISICFTNTKPNMPPWGGKESRIGNNPFVAGIPRKEGHVVLDMALSQYSFGKINDNKLSGEPLSFSGGWDENDQLTNDPEKIMQTGRGLPIGYWKGSGLSMILDMLVTILSAGDSTYQIGKRESETSISQVFICIDPEKYGDRSLQEKLLQEIIDYARDVEPMKAGERTYYPGEKTLQTRTKNMKGGIPVETEIWHQVNALLV